MNEAVARIRGGCLVAFPTETVYGLGANALDPKAVERIFRAKGRPATNPLIVHIANLKMAHRLSGNWSETAQRLAEHFWPGPLTIIVPKAPSIPGIVTAGGSTVGLRMPAHPVALELLRLCDLPLAAPSANRSEEVSPTTAAHVAESLGSHVNDLLILDGGATPVGLESTVIDTTTLIPRILRPGMVTAAMLREVIGDLAEGDGSTAANLPADTVVVRSPGQMARHYAPHAPLFVLSNEALAKNARSGDAILVLERQGDSRTEYNYPNTMLVFPMPPSANGYAAHLYDTLRVADGKGVSRILVEQPPLESEWTAIHDRLRRASMVEK